MISKKYDTRVHSLLWRGVCQRLLSSLYVLAFGDQTDNVAVAVVFSSFLLLLYHFFGFVFINTLRLLAGPVTLLSAFYCIQLTSWILFDFFFLIFGHFDVLFLYFSWPRSSFAPLYF